MIGWLIFFAVLLLLFAMPCGLYASYNSGKTILKLIVGPLRINLIPAKKEKKKNAGKKMFESHERVKEKKRIMDYWPIVQLIFDLLSDFGKKITVQDLGFKMILGGGDPYDLSINYGRYWAVLGNLMPHLESWFTIKKRDLEIACDYTASNTKIDTSIDLRLSVFALFHMALHHGIRIIIKYYKISKEAKDGAVS